MPETRMRSLIYRWLALLGAVGLLHLCGRGALGAPSLTRLSTLITGTRSRPPVEEAVTVIRLLALGAGGYLLIIVSIAILGRIAGHGPTLSWAAQLTPSCLRGVLALATTAAITIGTTAGIAAAAGSSRPPTLRWVGAAPGTAAGTAAPGPAAPGPAAPGPAAGPPAPGPILRWAGATPPTRSGGPALRRAGTTPPTTTPGSAHRSVPTGPRGPGSTASTAPTSPTGTGSRVSTAPTGPTGTGSTGAADPTVAPADHPGRRVPGRAGLRPIRPVSSRGAGPTTYVVRSGDDFWSIAAARVRSAAGPADGTAVAAYWRVLIQANLKNLPVPGQPDLLFPGDRLQLPRLP